MDRLLRGKEEYAAAYMDDFVIFSNDWESHRIHLRDVLETLKQANLTVKLSKCRFGQTHVSYLGHIVGSGQVKPQKTKVDAIETWEKPKGREPNLVAALASQPAADHSLSFITSIVIMTLG